MENVDFENDLWEDINYDNKVDEKICSVTLLNPRTGETTDASGINWGQNPNNHTVLSDSYIPIRTNHIRNHPKLFPPKSQNPTVIGGRKTRHNDPIEMLWDDGTIMQGIFEGNYKINNTLYPKQISSFPKKNILGKYIRERLGIHHEKKVTKNDLINSHNRTDIEISLIDSNSYFMDFSKKK